MQHRNSLIRIVVCWKVLALPVTVSIVACITLSLSFTFLSWRHANSRGIARVGSMARAIASLAPCSFVIEGRTTGAVRVFKAPIGRMTESLVYVAPQCLWIEPLCGIYFTLALSGSLSLGGWSPLSVICRIWRL